MKRRLIDAKQDYDVVCDNSNCDYKVLNLTGVPNLSDEYLNKPCPNCGDNLLTNSDWVSYKRFVKVVNFINKWFYWLTYILPKPKKEEKVLIGFRGSKTIVEQADNIISLTRTTVEGPAKIKLSKNKYETD